MICGLHADLMRTVLQWFKEHVEGDKPAATIAAAPVPKVNGAAKPTVADKAHTMNIEVGTLSADADSGANDDVQVAEEPSPKKSRKPLARFTAYVSAFLGL